MEKLKLRKTFKHWEENDKWCCGIWCYRGENKNSILVNGWDKNRNKADKKAMSEFSKSLKFHREFERKPEKQELILEI